MTKETLSKIFDTPENRNKEYQRGRKEALEENASLKAQLKCWEQKCSGVRKEAFEEVEKIIEEVKNGVMKDMENPKVKRTDKGIVDGFAHLLLSKLYLNKAKLKELENHSLQVCGGKTNDTLCPNTSGNVTSVTADSLRGKVPTYCKGCSFKCQASDCECICHEKMDKYWKKLEATGTRNGK